MSNKKSTESLGLDKDVIDLLRNLCRSITRDMYKINEFAMKAGVDERAMREFIRHDGKQRRKIDPANFLKPVTEFIVNNIPIEYLDNESAIMIKKLHSSRRDRYIDNTPISAFLTDVLGNEFDIDETLPRQFAGKYIGYRYTYQAKDMVRLSMEISVDPILKIPSFSNYFVRRQKTIRITRGFGCYIREQLYLFGHVNTGAAIKSFVFETSFEGPHCLPGLVLTFGPNGRPFASRIVLVPLDAHHSISFDQPKYQDWIKLEEFGNIPLGVFPVEDIKREWKLLNIDGTLFSDLEDMISNKVEPTAVLRIR